MTNHLTHAGLTTAIGAPSGVLVLNAPRRCAFVLRPSWMTLLTRSESQRRQAVSH